MEFVLTILGLVGLGFTLQKAGRAVWEGMIPVYNLYVLICVVGKPWWWLLLLLFVPLANIVVLVLLFHELAKRFGKGALWTAFMIVLPFIAFPILGFSKNEQFH